MKHSPEPWKLAEGWEQCEPGHFIEDSNGKIIYAELFDLDENGHLNPSDSNLWMDVIFDKPDLERIVACVNAYASRANEELKLSALPKKIYLIRGQSGAYSDRIEWILEAHTTLENAKIKCQLLNEKVKKAHSIYEGHNDIKGVYKSDSSSLKTTKILELVQRRLENILKCYDGNLEYYWRDADYEIEEVSLMG